MMFVGRDVELALLERQHRGPGAALVPIYGRRRVGKSELIVRFLEGKRAIYVVGKTAPAPLQMREFLSQSARVLDEPLLANLPADDWRGALLEVTRRARGQKLVIAYPTGAISVLDATSGNELWYTQVEGAVLASTPAVGDGCVAFRS